MWSRRELKTKAKEVLKKSYWKAFLVSLIIAFAGGNRGGGGFNFNWNMNNFNFNRVPNRIPENFSGRIPGSLEPFGDLFNPAAITFISIFLVIFIIVLFVVIAFRVFLGFPLEVGGRRFFIREIYKEADLNNLGYGFQREYYKNIIITMFLRGLYNFLWFLLFIIPGIIKSYSYRMVPYILANNPNIEAKRAIELSNKMTSGHKFNMFVLDLSFLGWYILGTIAFFVGVLFVFPYENAVKAELYLVLRQNAIDSGLSSYEELRLEVPTIAGNEGSNEQLY